MIHAIWTTKEREAYMGTSILQTSGISNKLKLQKPSKFDNTNQLPISENEENDMSFNTHGSFVTNLLKGLR
jgi:hypothetical protein